jgi:hypothetical protein
MVLRPAESAMMSPSISARPAIASKLLVRLPDFVGPANSATTGAEGHPLRGPSSSRESLTWANADVITLPCPYRAPG